MTLNVLRFAAASAAAEGLANAVAHDVRQALGARQRVLLLVSGGRSPLNFFPALAAQALPWDRLDVSLVDERCVPFDHPDSNAGLIARHLLQGHAAAARLLPLVPERLPGEDAPQWAQRAALQARQNPAFAQAAAVVLGLGNDGHTASIFSDAPQYLHAVSTAERYVAVIPAHAPHARVSLSLSALIGQRRCYAWTSGAAKLALIEDMQALIAELAAGIKNEDALRSAGPFALLAAHPEVELRVFHSDQE